MRELTNIERKKVLDKFNTHNWRLNKVNNIIEMDQSLVESLVGDTKFLKKNLEVLKDFEEYPHYILGGESMRKIMIDGLLCNPLIAEELHNFYKVDYKRLKSKSDSTEGPIWVVGRYVEEVGVCYFIENNKLIIYINY